MAGSNIDAFLDALEEATEVLDRAGVATLLDARIAQAQWAWPDIAGDPTRFAAYLGARLPDGTDIASSLGSMKIADLYLAWGCTEGDDAALTAFSRHFDEMVDGAVQRFASQGIDVDDAKQDVLDHILFPTQTRPAAISFYGGHGTLKGYLGVTVVREVLRMIKARKRTPTVDPQDVALALIDMNDDPEVQVLKNRYRAEFKEAFQETMGGLEAADRNLLRYYYVSGLTLEQIAAVSGVRHNTVSRRLAKIRGALLQGTRDRLIAMVGIRETQFDSIVRLVQSQLHVSMYRMLNPEDGADE